MIINGAYHGSTFQVTYDGNLKFQEEREETETSRLVTCPISNLLSCSTTLICIQGVDNNLAYGITSFVS